MKFILSKMEFLIAIAIAIGLSVLFWNFLSKVPIGLADPKPRLPPMEENRIYHPKGFSIIAPQGWKSFVETGEKQNLNRIWIQPDIDARWSPKLIARIYNKDENPYTLDTNDYQLGRYLEFDAKIYEGLWADYHGWHAVFSNKGMYYGVLLMLPHGHGLARYGKVPDYWWPFLNSFRIDSKLGMEIAKEGKNMTMKDILIAKIKKQPEAESIRTKSGTVEEFIQDTSKEPTPSPIVTLEDFFEGNSDLGSIGCNLIPHPRIEKFYQVLKEIRSKENVQDVFVEIYNIDDEYADWPFAEIIYVITDADIKNVIEWLKPLKPDEVIDGWSFGKPPSKAPDIKDGYKVFHAWWD